MHKCIGPKSDHTRPADYGDSALLVMYHEHREPGWYEKVVAKKNCKSPATLRRWMRMVTQEVHRRGLTP